MIHLMNQAKEMGNMVNKLKEEIIEMVNESTDIELLDLIHQMLEQE